jgi:uncharacterized circularly permuted ATP-grasp superfamily protein/uncharacterized alpha-E superfamily protein
MDQTADQAKLPGTTGVEEKMPPHWETFFQSYSRLGNDEIATRNEDLTRLMRENGVTYNIYGDPSGLNRPWKLDMIPFLMSKEEWTSIEAGLQQRAQLLNAILEDIYGDRKLIRHGILPFELLYNHPGFLRQCCGIKLPGRHHLVMYSADLARSRDGRVWVVNDRTQAPSGSGYALENRTAMTRVVPELFDGLKVRHLSPYFNTLQQSLTELAPQQRGRLRQPSSPRIVILTPGSSNETYFEHAYLSSYLGFTLVQGNDLVVKDNFVWLKTMGGLERVDVILRRVDDNYCDPLELKADSQLGVPGLLQAVRSGHVTIANPIGSSILENPGLMPFLQSMARFFLSEDLLIPTIASWWCGQPKELKYVLNHLPSLVIKTIYRHPSGSSSIDGASLSAAQLQQLKARILANPALYVGQEKVAISTTPSLIDGHIEPRQVLFRSFLVSSGENYVAMEGGLCRTSSDQGNFIISNQSGGFSKDAWILSPEASRNFNVLKEVAGYNAPEEDNLTSHAAENLFWVGRYTERVLGNARFLRTVMQFLAEGNKLATDSTQLTEKYLLEALTQNTFTYPGFTGPDSAEQLAQPWEELKDVLLNAKRTGGIKYNFLHFQRAIHEVRDHWSTDTWRVLRTMEEELAQDIPLSHHGHIRMLHTLDNLITFIIAFIGLNRESISREQGWRVLDTGRKIEQSLLLLTMLRTTLVNKTNDQVDYHLQQSVLMSHECLVNYRYKYRQPIDKRLVLDFMLFDPNNPRSLTHLINRLTVHLKHLPKDQAGHSLTGYERLILEADTLLKLSDKDSLSTPGTEDTYTQLDEFLTRMYGLLATIPDVISKTYFKHESTSRSFDVL